MTLAFAASRAADLQVELKALVFGSQLALRYGYVSVGHGIGGAWLGAAAAVEAAWSCE